ncbi:signal recognition particle receptor subunit beta [Toxorhynchites rutilus septentrionalis]|uniref:signal recognition particle receptor subunit beta n=1 Tax=Toxorhynchites rutilus septentrionalis TaxID=329112 RepID=UPI002479E385|nr:signal recognition particle receptor subunit beta [Toxorhynchites rutilus septentrionalis]
MDKASRKFTTRTLGDQEQLDYTPILLAILVILFTLLLLFIWKKKRTTRSDVLLAGLCDSGKTLLFSHLILGEAKETFTSIKENVGYLTNSNGELRIVDIPGHERLRGKFFDQYKNLSKAIVFVIDSVTVQKDIRDVADFLYTILADKAIANLPVVILCNKQDEDLAKGDAVIKSMLEKEINVVRQTRTSQLQSVDPQSSDAVFLGRSDKDFDFSQVSQNVKFVLCSASDNQMDDLNVFLDTL